ncbi:MAG: hypothetical protein NVS9B8_18390 [Candidatus Limnocylindrales bacterium]
MYLSTLSGAMVALGLVARIDHAGDVFVGFALVILPVVLFVGLATFVRMGAANYHDAMTVVGMNRIRGAYLELAPTLEPYLVMSAHDDPPGIAVTMALIPGRSSLLHVISATPFVVNALNGAVAGAVAGVATLGVLGVGPPASAVVSAVAFAVIVLAQLRLVESSMRRGRSTVRPMFPTKPVPSAPVTPGSSAERGPT